MKKIFFLFFTGVLFSPLFSQTVFTHADSLRGGLRPERTHFDVYYYDLQVDVDISHKYIQGTVKAYFTVVTEDTQPLYRLQMDLFKNMNILSIKDAAGEPMTYTRDENAIFISRKEAFKKGEKLVVDISYDGNPIVAKMAPWDGGFVFSRDRNGNPWVAVACEGIGASLWWPNKDHLSDEPDSMKISITCPSSLVAVSNGNLADTKISGEKTMYVWKVNSPINNYNVTLNIGKYVSFKETYAGIEGTYDLDYYVMDYNLDRAKKHFTQVKPMLASYEKILGPYPFPRDGFALVETPYLGMEHQGAIAYGNKYQKGYDGADHSMLGLPFDFIIIHETGHEYWGNSVTNKDLADMWIHEGFCTYTEALYVEDLHGADTALLYCNSWKYRVANNKPVTGAYGVNNEGSVDMYYKGALMLHTLRWVVNDDKKWFAMLKGVQKDFRWKTVSADEIITYMNTALGNDYTWLFNQYLNKQSPPILNYTMKQKGKNLEVTMKWDATDADFKLPLTVTGSDNNQEKILVTPVAQTFIFKNRSASTFKVDETHAYFIVKYEF